MFSRLMAGVLLSLLAASKATAQAGVEKKPLSFKEFLNPTALLEWESAYALKGRKLQKTEFILKPELNIDLSKNVRWVILGRFYSELTDNLEPARPGQEEVSDFSRRWIINRRLEAELREFYFDIRIKKTFITVGKQQIVWGKADGLRVLDLVNPFNFREFLLDEFEDSRIPLWSVKANIPVKGITVQLVWIPDQSYHDLPDPLGTYTLQQPVQDDLSVYHEPMRKPDRIIKDSDIGLRLSTFFKGWDLSINYLYFYDDFPVNFQSMLRIDDTLKLNISPRYLRNHLLGGTFSNAFGSFTLRGETGFIFDKYLASNDPGQSEGVIKSNQMMTVAGLDYTGITNTTLSAQLFVDWVTNNAHVVGRDHFETNASLLLSRNFMNETLTVEVIGIQNFNRGEGFVQGKVSYFLRSNLSLWFGGEIIHGRKSSVIGQFRNQDRVYLGMELGI